MTTPTSTPMPLRSSSTPASPAVLTLDNKDDEDIAEDVPMPTQPLLLRQDSHVQSGSC